jgi:hypothetical protein
MRQPSGKLLVTLFVFIFGTVLGSWGKAFGIPGIVAGSLVGAALGWFAGKWVMDRIF